MRLVRRHDSADDILKALGQQVDRFDAVTDLAVISCSPSGRVLREVLVSRANKDQFAASRVRLGAKLRKLHKNVGAQPVGVTQRPAEFVPEDHDSFKTLAKGRACERRPQNGTKIAGLVGERRAQNLLMDPLEHLQCRAIEARVELVRERLHGGPRQMLGQQFLEETVVIHQRLTGVLLDGQSLQFAPCFLVRGIQNIGQVGLSERTQHGPEHHLGKAVWTIVVAQCDQISPFASARPQRARSVQIFLCVVVEKARDIGLI